MDMLISALLLLLVTFIIYSLFVFFYFKLKIKLGWTYSLMAIWVVLKGIPYFLRKNDAWINPELDLEFWTLVKDGRHNSNSFLIHWKDEFWLAHANSPYHFASPDCKIMIWRSKDARKWEKSLELQVPFEDIRDPKFSVINGQLFMYVLKSIDFNPEPYGTAYISTKDGKNWSELKELTKNEGWLFWNPKTFDGTKWYVPAYWFLHGKSVLLETIDGIDFNYVSTIHNGKTHEGNDRNDETDISFYPDGTMISTQRLEYSEDLHGDKRACTNITISKPPYAEWIERGKDYTTRLDGPCLFSFNNNVYAVGRFNPLVTNSEHMASPFTPKRTSLFLVTEEGLIRLSDFLSSADTSYGGVVLKDGFAYCTYYSNDPLKDWSWLFGMTQPSDIRLAKIPLEKMEKIANEVIETYRKDNLFNFKKASQ
jgi:hypothetical protein